jgi:hypothetical protein
MRHAQGEPQEREGTRRVNTPSGWYDDTTRPNVERFWNGWTWTEQARYPGGTPFESPVPPGLAEPLVGPPEVASMVEASTVGYSLPRDESTAEVGAKTIQILHRLRSSRRR